MVDLHTIRWREIRDFVKAVLEVQKETDSTLAQAKATVALMLQCTQPTSLEFRQVRNEIAARGRPKSVAINKAYDFAILAMYFRAQGKKQYIKAAMDFWAYPLHNRDAPPTARLVEEAVQSVRGWDIVNLKTHAEIVRHRYKLPELPSFPLK